MTKTHTSAADSRSCAGRRVFRHEWVWRLDQSRVAHGIRMLALAAQHRYSPVTLVVGVNDGGWRMAIDAAAVLGVERSLVIAQPRSDPSQRSSLYTQASKDLSVHVSLDDKSDRDPGFKTVLVLTDVC